MPFNKSFMIYTLLHKSFLQAGSITTDDFFKTNFEEIFCKQKTTF